MGFGREEGKALHAMSIDDAYEVMRVLASGPGGTTELVTIEGSGPYLRKKISSNFVNRQAWAAVHDCSCRRLPQIVATYETPDAFVVVSDFVPGETVAQLVASRGPFSEDTARQIVLEVCQALGELHRHGVVHCDITPENVVIAADGAHLIDLGIARPVGYKSESGTPALGTWGFAAPEQYGFAPVDERTDVYSAAQLLGYMLTGLRPDEGGYEATVSRLSVDTRLQTVVSRGSAFEPSGRYQTVSDMAEAVCCPVDDNATKSRVFKVPGEGKVGRPSPSPECDIPSSRIPKEEHVPLRLRRGLRLLAFALMVVVAVALVGFFGDGLFQPPLSDTRDLRVAEGSVSENVSQNMTWGVRPSSGDDSIDGKLQNLSIKESWWAFDGYEYTNWLFGVSNNGAEVIRSFQIQIVGRDAEGNVVSSDYQSMRPIQPGQTVYLAGLSDNGANAESIEFAIEPDSDERMAKGGASDLVLSVDNVSVNDRDPKHPSFLGEVSLLSGNYQGIGNGLVLVTVVLRDNDGNIVGGESTVTEQPKIGSPQTFDTLGSSLSGRYSSYEVFAYEW